MLEVMHELFETLEIDPREETPAGRSFATSASHL